MLSEDDCEYWIRNFVNTNEDRLTIDQKLALQDMIKNKMSSSDRILSTSHLWEKLLSYLDPGNRYLVTTNADGKLSKQTCFMHNYTWVPMEKYKADVTDGWIVIPERIEDIQQMSALN